MEMIHVTYWSYKEIGICKYSKTDKKNLNVIKWLTYHSCSTGIVLTKPDISFHQIFQRFCPNLPAGSGAQLMSVASVRRHLIFTACIPVSHHGTGGARGGVLWNKSSEFGGWFSDAQVKEKTSQSSSETLEHPWCGSFRNKYVYFYIKGIS